VHAFDVGAHELHDAATVAADVPAGRDERRARGENLHLLCAGAGKLFHFPLMNEQHGRFAGDTGVDLAGDQ